MSYALECGNPVLAYPTASTSSSAENLPPAFINRRFSILKPKGKLTVNMAQPLFLFRCPTAAASTRRVINPSSSHLNLSTTTIAHSRNVHSSLRPYRQSLCQRQQPKSTQLTPVARSSYSHLRSYHSKHHPDPPAHEYTNSQTTILSAALNHVPEHGFTLDSLTLGARDVGFLDVSVQLFPRRELDLVFFWLASRRGLLRGKVENGLFEDLSISDPRTGKVKKGNELSVEEKVKVLILERLKMNKEIRHKWQDVCFPVFLYMAGLIAVLTDLYRPSPSCPSHRTSHSPYLSFML